MLLYTDFDVDLEDCNFILLFILLFGGVFCIMLVAKFIFDRSSFVSLIKPKSSVDDVLK